jgi:hypothetical protein
LYCIVLLLTFVSIVCSSLLGQYTVYGGNYSAGLLVGAVSPEYLCVGAQSTQLASLMPFVGEFEVLEINYNQNEIRSLAIDFVRRCPTSPFALRGQVRYQSNIPIAEVDCDIVDCVMGLWSDWFPSSPDACNCLANGQSSCRIERTRAILVQPNASGLPCGIESEVRTKLIPPCGARELMPYLFQYTNYAVMGPYRECEAITESAFIEVAPVSGWTGARIDVVAKDWTMEFQASATSYRGRPFPVIGMNYNVCYFFKFY